MQTINIIPADYNGNPRNALGYGWQDYATKTPGVDVVVERTENGIDYMGAAMAAMREMGITEAYINCMWCGGFSGMIEVGAIDAEEIAAPLAAEEVAAYERAADEDALTEMDRNNHGRPGWCNICHSFCFGDCQANR